MANTAQRSGLSMIAETPEEQAALQKVMASRKALEDALQSRENQLFDPVLLAIAQGMLAPTKTGRFGESLGNVAAMVGPAQAAEDKRAMEVAQIRAELAAQELGMAQQAQTEKYLRERPSIFGGAPAGAAQQPTAPGAGQGATAQQPTAASQAVSAATGAAPTAPVISGDQAYAFLEKELQSRRPEVREAAKNSLELLKARSGAIKVQDRVVVDTSVLDAQGRPRVIADFGEQKPQEIVYKGEARSIPMTAMERQNYQDAVARGPAAAEAYFDANFKGRRSGAEAMPYGGERGMFSIRIPDVNNPNQLLTLTGEGTARQRALIEQAEEKAFASGDFSELQRLFNQVTGQGQYAGRAPARAAAAPGEPPSARVTPQEQAQRDEVAKQVLNQELSKESQRMADAIRDNNPEDERRARENIASIRRELARAQGIPAGLAVDPELASLPIAEQNKIMVERINASEKEAREQMSLIRQVGAPQMIAASDRRNKEILSLATDNPKVFNLLAKQGLFTALAAAANEGFKVGTYSVSAPVQTFLNKLNLTPDEQKVARRVAMLLDEEFFNRAAYNKTVLGPQISNADTVLMKSPMARPEDSAKIIAYWAQHALLTNRQAAELFSAATKYPANRSPKYFIADEASNIMNAYTPRYQVLQQRFSGGG